MRVVNHYSRLEQLLHALVLSSQAVRVATFDLESALVQQHVNTQEDHVFISGMARSGTTALLNSIYVSGCFASLTYSDMPFVMAPNLWSKLNFGGKLHRTLERAHGDRVLISTVSPEAFEEVFWKTFPESSSTNEIKFRQFVRHILVNCRKKRYLSKNNQSYQRLSLIAKIFPKSTILIPFRSPISHAYSLLGQHVRFLQASEEDPFMAKYMSLIAHCEFGPNYSPGYTQAIEYSNPLDINHWLEQWVLTYEKLAVEITAIANAHLVCYEKLCADEKSWQNIKETCQIDINSSFEMRPRDYDLAKVDGALLHRSNGLYNHLRECSI